MKNKYDLIEMMNDKIYENSLEMIKDIRRIISDKNNTPKEMYVVVIMGHKFKNNKSIMEIKEGRTNYLDRHSFIKVHVYDNMLDAIRKVNKHVKMVRCIKLFVVSSEFYVSIISRNIPFNYKQLDYPIIRINDTVLETFAKLVIMKHDAKIIVHF